VRVVTQVPVAVILFISIISISPKAQGASACTRLQRETESVPEQSAQAQSARGQTLASPVQLDPSQTGSDGQPKETGWCGKSVEELKEAQARAPENPLADYNLGAALYVAGRYDEAVEFLAAAARLDAQFAAARRTLGLAYFKLRRYDEAVESFKELTRLQPELAEAHNNLGVAYCKAGKHKEAVASLREAVRLEPDNAGSRFNLGVSLVALSQKEAALEQHAALASLDPALARKLFALIYRDKILDVSRK
jgi:tetratricopeptide (TPR) repeat protein